MAGSAGPRIRRRAAACCFRERANMPRCIHAAAGPVPGWVVTQRMNVVTPGRGLSGSGGWNAPVPGNKLSDENRRPGPDPAVSDRDMGVDPMVLWPAVTLIGFLVLTALVIAMGTSSTARYEREREAAPPGTARAAAAAEPLGAA